MAGTLLPGAAMVVTSQPCLALPSVIFQHHVLLLGLAEDTDDYVCCFFPGCEEPVAAVARHLKAPLGLAGLCFVPLYCHMLCSVLDRWWQDALPVPAPTTVTEVYAAYVAALLGPQPAPQLWAQLLALAGRILFAKAELRGVPGSSPLRCLLAPKDNGAVEFFHPTVQEFVAAVFAIATL
ncbi:NACHT, LRR and PYD domains-containing protein 12-like [Alligator sinensis]|uniref:NACHT, LRR and PYD domains-containing protein 12-like n=1 Tax=Alligator sinensis TaxID=38654 RepID=A0A3Q0FV00_ALLSI|nr:NACHT, LRR and PYD domains-containing protein 12-like [Alligator sinensis]